MAEELKQVYVPTVANAGEVETHLGCFSKEEDAWDVMRAFLAKAAATDVVKGSIVIWELDYVGEEGRYELSVFDRRPCPICEELTFWVEGAEEKARCYYPRCGAWIEQNPHDHERWDCGWPSANWNKRADSYRQAFGRLIEMRAQSNSAGNEHKMPTREAWLDGQDRERRAIHKMKVDSLLDEMTD